MGCDDAGLQVRPARRPSLCAGGTAIVMVQKFGGDMIAGTATPKVLEGEWDGNWAAVLRFPGMEMAEAWYNSDEYQPLRDLRVNELTEPGGVLLR